MMESIATPSAEPADALHDALAEDDATLRTVRSMMRQLLQDAQHPALTEEVVARVRGSVFDLARQLLHTIAQAEGAGCDRGEAPPLDTLFTALIEVPGLVGHFHAVALEWQLTEGLRTRSAIDPVAPPLLHALLASEDAATSAIAMSLLAAQARFVHSQRRMQFPLHELSADLLHGALLAVRSLDVSDATAAVVESQIRSSYNEGRTRLGLTARVVTSIGARPIAALSLREAGLAIFATGLNLATGQNRDLVILSTCEEQSVRLALLMRAAGFDHGAIHQELFVLHANPLANHRWDEIAPERAASLLNGAVRRSGY